MMQHLHGIIAVLKHRQAKKPTMTTRRSTRRELARYAALCRLSKALANTPADQGIEAARIDDLNR